MFRPDSSAAGHKRELSECTMCRDINMYFRICIMGSETECFAVSLLCGKVFIYCTICEQDIVAVPLVLL